MVQYGRSSRSSWAESVRSSFGRIVMGKAIWEKIEGRLGEGFQLWMLIRTPWRRIVLICVWMTSNWLERSKTLIHVESTQYRSWFGRTHIFPWSRILGLHSKTMWNKQRYCGQLQNHVWITNFRGGNWKITMFWKSSYLFVVIWHGWSCRAMCATILWVDEQSDSTTLQSIYFMHRWPSFRRRRIEIRWRIVKSMLSDVSEMFILGTCSTTQHSMVNKRVCSYIHHTCEYK